MHSGNFIGFVNGLKEYNNNLRIIIKDILIKHESQLNELKALLTGQIKANKATLENTTKDNITTPEPTIQIKTFANSAPGRQHLHGKINTFNNINPFSNTNPFNKATGASPTIPTFGIPSALSARSSPPLKPPGNFYTAAAPSDPDGGDSNSSDDGYKPDPLIGRPDIYGGKYSSYKPTFFTPTPDSKEDKTKLKKEDVGIFNPYTDNPNNINILEVGISIVYTDAFIFKKRLLSLVTNNPRGAIRK